MGWKVRGAERRATWRSHLESIYNITGHFVPPRLNGSNGCHSLAHTGPFYQILVIRGLRGRVGHLIKIIKTMFRMLVIEIIFALCKKILRGVNFGDFYRDAGTWNQKSVYTILMRKTSRYITL